MLLMKKFDLLSFNNYNSRINNKESIRIRDNYMCNLSQGIREEGLAEGITKGLERASQKEELILHCAMSNVLYKKIISD